MTITLLFWEVKKIPMNITYNYNQMVKKTMTLFQKVNKFAWMVIAFYTQNNSNYDLDGTQTTMTLFQKVQECGVPK